MATTLFNQISKLPIPGLDVEYWYSRITSYPENEWFQPNNIEHQDFQICFELQLQNLIEKRNEPIWIDNSFRGQRIFFRYNTGLIYPVK